MSRQRQNWRDFYAQAQAGKPAAGAAPGPRGGQKGKPSGEGFSVSQNAAASHDLKGSEQQRQPRC